MESVAKLDHFPVTDEAWKSRLESLDPKRYAATRNHLRGAVSGLSPYFTHGFLSLREAVDAIRQRERLTSEDKLFAEFAWRSFFHHVWAHQGNAIFTDLRPAIPNVRYANELPEDIREGRTGLAVIDQAVTTLYSTGYLHNHARMWLASYIVHLRHVHWRVGADWLYSHLLDGDLASNHLSWQWVAGTFSTKPYLFNADNVAKYAPPDWHCHGTPLDTSYESLEQMARGYRESDRSAFRELPRRAERLFAGVEEPGVYSEPPPAILKTLGCPLITESSEGLEDHDAIEVVHAWGLRAQSLVPSDSAKNLYRLGVIHLPSHASWPWSQKRWQFVLGRMGAICNAVFIGDASNLKKVLLNLRRSYYVNEPGAAATRQALTDSELVLLEPPQLFKAPNVFCPSFSKYFRCVGSL
jgi:deoxyribodipyrimidine photo-lyase